MRHLVSTLSILLAVVVILVGVAVLAKPSGRADADRMLVSGMQSQYPDADPLDTIALAHRICASLDEGWTYNEIAKTPRVIGVKESDVYFMVLVSVRYICPEHGARIPTGRA